MNEAHSYMFMHRDDPVAVISTNDGIVAGVKELIDPEKLPIGVMTENPKLLDLRLGAWFMMRGIPDNRVGYRKIITTFGERVSLLKFDNLNLSMTDCYWTCPIPNPGFLWKDINFHENDFDSSLAYVVFCGKEAWSEGRSPDFTTDGISSKAWLRLKGKPYLLKAPGKEGTFVQCANEIASSIIAPLFGVEHAANARVVLNGNRYSASRCFVKDQNTDFTNIKHIHMACGQAPDLTYRYFVENGMQQNVDRMILFDFIRKEQERINRNCGILYNADTKSVCFAPLFDSGESFGLTRNSLNSCRDGLPPFKKTWEEQFESIDHRNLILPKKEKILDIIRKTYDDFEISAEELCCAEKSVTERYEWLETKYPNGL